MKSSEVIDGRSSPKADSIVWAFVAGEIMRGVGLVLASRKYR